MGDRQEAGFGALAHLVEQVTEPLDVVIVERRVDLVEHADRRRVGQEHGEDQSQRGQRLLAAGKQGQRLRLLARRARDQFKSGLERIVGFDEQQLRRSAFEQRREQLAEMLVDDVESADQPLAAFLVKGADRLPEPLNRLGEVIALGDQFFARRLHLGEFDVGAQVDRAEPLALLLEVVEPALNRRGVGRFIAGLEPGEGEKTAGIDIELEFDEMKQLRAAFPRRFKPLLSRRARFSRAGHRFERSARGAVGFAERRFARGELVRRGFSRRLRFRELRKQTPALQKELGRSFGELFELLVSGGAPIIKLGDLRFGASAPLAPRAALLGDTLAASVARFALAAQRLFAGARLSVFGARLSRGGAGAFERQREVVAFEPRQRRLGGKPPLHRLVARDFRTRRRIHEGGRFG